jgi:hypothetical protein
MEVIQQIIYKIFQQRGNILQVLPLWIFQHSSPTLKQIYKNDGLVFMEGILQIIYKI